MTTAMVAFLVAFLAGAGVTAVMPRIAFRLGAVDLPDGYRKIHGVAIPRLGGVGVFAGFLMPMLVLLVGFRDNLVALPILQDMPTFLSILAGALVVLLMGAWDDIRPVRAGVKILCQLLAAEVAMAGGLVIWRLSLPFVGEVGLGPLAIPLTLFWFLGCMNAINLLDGMDGLAGGVSLIVCVTMALAGWLMGNPTGTLLMGCLGGGIFGFLVFNFHPARIFLGDSGSNVIGFLIAALGLITSRKGEAAVALVVPVLALGVPIIDTGLAILRRWSQRLPLSAPDRQHIHHRLLSMGLTQRRAVFIIYGLCVVLCAGAVMSITDQRGLLFMVVGAVGILVYVCVRILGGTHLGDLGARLGRDWRLRQAGNLARIEMERCAHALPNAPSLDALWASCGPALAALQVDEARLALDSAHEVRPELVWRSATWQSEPTPADDVWQVRLDVRGAGASLGRLVITADLGHGRLCFPERLELALRLRALLATHVPRLRAEAPGAQPGMAQPAGARGQA
jgi:UDP-GlcNAc:undecaprenyl-phosphate GlcNAc-1-phosphate transferase